MTSNLQPVVAQLTSIANDLLEEVDRMLAEDLRDPALNPAGLPEGREGFIGRVSAVGLQLMNQRDYCLAAEVYRNCIHETRVFREATGEERHLGTLYANLAIACLCHGSVDEGIYNFQKAAEEDFKTAGVGPDASYANVLVKQLTDHVTKMLSDILVGHRLSITQNHIENLFNNLPRHYYFALLAYSYSFVYSYQYLQDLGSAPWFYTYNQMISALRNMTALFEDMQRSGVVSSSSRSTLNDLLQDRFAARSGCAASWWGLFARQQGPLSTTLHASGFVSVIQAIDALARPTPNDDIACSVLVTYFTRNHLGHRLTQVNEVDLPLASNLLGSLLHAMTHAR